MLSDQELQILKEKILQYELLLRQEDIGGACLLRALELYDEHSGGLIYWIGQLTSIGLDFGINHAYYFTPQANDHTIALNLSDNGFPHYPPLTKREVEVIGVLQSPSVIHQTFTRKL